jgi:hypothetical protein
MKNDINKSHEDAYLQWYENKKQLRSQEENIKHCPNGIDGKHVLDDGRCMLCDLDMEYSS